MDLIGLVLSSDLLSAIAVIAFVGALLLILTMRLRLGHQPHLRPLRAFTTLEGDVGQATESASQMHISLGQAGLTSAANPTSVAALTILDRLAKDGCANGTPPLVTVGEGTMLLVAQERLLYAYRQAERTRDFEPGLAQFVASETDPIAYAGGVASLIQQGKVSSNVLVGHFGPEIAIMAEAAAHKNIDQIIGADDPVTLALGAAITDNILIGEELFAAGAYLEGKINQLAALQAQDILRLLIAIVILGLAIFQIIK